MSTRCTVEVRWGFSRFGFVLSTVTGYSIVCFCGIVTDSWHFMSGRCIREY